jgi:type IX secretion system PorP/SprF family membrane protein
MNYKKSFLTLLLTISFSSRVFSQQEIYSYSQFSDYLTPVNAAYSMLDKSGSISLLGHKQFIGIEDAPTSLMFTGNLPIESIKASAGLYALNNKTPLVRQMEINAFFAKSIQLTANQFLSVAINAGMRNYASNYSSLDPSDPEFVTDVRDTKPNIGFGIMYYSEKFYFGLSMPQLTFGSPQTAFAEKTDLLKSHYYIAGAYIFGLAQDIKLKPAVLVSYAKNTPLLGSLSGTIYLYENLSVGISYNSDDFIAGILSLSFSNFKIGYSYGFGTSGNASAGNLNNARNEIGLTYRFGKKLLPKFL